MSAIAEKHTIDFVAVERQVAEGYIKKEKHPTADLWIYNYTVKAQFDWHWTPETMACRGLIVDGGGNIVARPFEKFFSYEQLNGQVPSEPFEVFEKLDGSLGILYWAHGEPAIATRGSFVGEQARWATAHFRTSYWSDKLDPSLTHLFEIIYPENRIVCDYGDTADLFLLAIIDTQTGRELPLRDIGVPMVKRHDGLTDFAALKSLEEKNREGFVVRFESGTRVKVKFDEYKRLHKLLTGVSAKDIWEAMSAGRGLADVIERTPDEFHQWVRGIETDLLKGFREIEEQSRADFKDLGDRKATAMYFQTCKRPSVLFAMLDGKDYTSLIWRWLKPKGVRPFRCGDDV